MMSYEAWLAGGRRVDLPRLGHTVFVRGDGPAAGPAVTLLHGFPTSSYDWAELVPDLVAIGRRVLTVDFLGFGDSDKPRRHRYSITGQADLVEEVWRLEAVGHSVVVAHDYAVSVAQELLARNSPAVDEVVFLNGGVYPDLHRPLPIQRLLRSPAGPALARLSSERTLAAALADICASPLAPATVHNLWQGVRRRGGRAIQHRLLHYIDDRKVFGDRWVAAMENASVPVSFVWGPRDPVSGAHVLDRIRQRMPHAPVRVLPDVGHYPQIEAPDQAGPAITGLIGGPP